MKDVVVLKADEIAHGNAMERQSCVGRGEHTKTGCVILAAGNSSRFGSNKLLASVRGNSLSKLSSIKSRSFRLGVQ